MSYQPFVFALCPSFRRPENLRTLLACWNAQRYPADMRRLIILEDSGDLSPQAGPNWELVTTSRRFASLPGKYNALLGMAGEPGRQWSDTDLIVIMEDDDLYLPGYIETHVAAVGSTGMELSQVLSKPSSALSLYTGQVAQEPADGRFHASLAATRGLFNEIGGWPLTQAGDFDQKLIRKLSEAAIDQGGIVDPCRFGPPQYVFRWASTGNPHGQSFMGGERDWTWWDKAGAAHQPRREVSLRAEMASPEELADFLRAIEFGKNLISDKF